MPRRETITYSGEAGGRASTHAYYLATTHDVMGFYCFDEPKEGGEPSFAVIDQLDRTRLLGAGNKQTAKIWAMRLGLTKYVYVRV